MSKLNSYVYALFSTLLYSLLLLSSSAAFSVSSAAKQAMALDYLHGEGELSGVRLAYRPYVTQLTSIEWLGDVDLYWEVSVNFWEYGANNQHDTNYVLALSPVLSSQFTSIANQYPLKWEFGIGISMVDDTQFAGKDIGSHYQFEDRLGLVMQMGDNYQQSVALRYMHYSNGGLNDKNPGVDFLNLSYAYHF